LLRGLFRLRRDARACPGPRDAWRRVACVYDRIYSLPLRDEIPYMPVAEFNIKFILLK
jgi:hypothetical protein